MPAIPRDLWPDSTLPLLADPYRYISRRARRMGTDVFRARLLGEPVVFLTGPGPAALFYEPGRFLRQGAIPDRVARVLFGGGGVQTLDEAAHHDRKALWLSLLDGDALERLAHLTGRAWDDALPEFAALDRVDVFLQTARVLTAGACAWAGVPLRQADVGGTSEMLSSLFLEAAAVGPMHRKARANRQRAHVWARSLVRAARRDRPAGRKDIVATLSAWHGADGNPLTTDVAATELLNVLRPVVAVAVYVCFTALALHRHPDCRIALAEDDAQRASFVQEVRRFYPFVPAVAARAAGPVSWEGMEIPEGTRTVLDLYGTCRDRRAWAEPDAFRPERFLSPEFDPWAMIPQGGGEHAVTHRCPGEWITIRLMAVLARRLALARYDVATPEARPNLRTVPALPKGGFLIENFRPG